MNTKTKISILVAMFSFLFFADYSSLAQDLEKEAAKQSLQDAIRPTVEYKGTQETKDPFKRGYGERKKEEPAGGEGQEASFPALEVQGIIWGGYLTQAIINNKVVKVGDEIEGARIIDIAKDGVIVFFEYQNYALPSPAAINLGLVEKGGSDEK